MATSNLSAMPAGRIRATPYARRLARERNLPLAAIAGSGPNGRITAEDLLQYCAPVGIPATATASPPALADLPPALSPAAPQPAAIVTRVAFTALEELLGQIAALRGDVAREDICLKAAAVALQLAGAATDSGDILLLAGAGKRQALEGVGAASVSAIAAMRASAGADGGASLAVSFLGRPGIRPVAARTIDGIPLRLVIGAPDRDGAADCLLSYDPQKTGDDIAEDLLATFRDLVETPFRLLV